VKVGIAGQVDRPFLAQFRPSLKVVSHVAWRGAPLEMTGGTKCGAQRASTLKAFPDRREIFAATAKPALRILSWTRTYAATSDSPHTGSKKSRRHLRNCSDLFTFAACTVFVAVAAYSAGVIFQSREFALAGDKKFLLSARSGDKKVLCQLVPAGRPRQFSHIWICLHRLVVIFPWRLRKN
jgi:hypothetical protein